jgi:hypothetical protein
MKGIKNLFPLKEEKTRRTQYNLNSGARNNITTAHIFGKLLPPLTTLMFVMMQQILLLLHRHWKVDSFSTGPRSPPMS